MTARPQNTSRVLTASLESNQNTQMAGKQTLADPAKGIIHRSRFALGDIGNRLTQKGAVAAGPEKKGLQPGKTGAAGTTNHKPPTSLAPSHNVPNPNAKGAKQLGRSNSTLGATNNAQGPKPARPRLVSRSQSTREKKPGAVPSATLVRIEERYIEAKVEVPVKGSALTVVGEENGSGDTDQKVTGKATDKAAGDVIEDLEVDSLAKAFSLQRFEIEDIDAKDVGEFMLKEYIKDIDEYLFNLEKQYTIREDFLKDRSVNSRMRAVLLDWLVEVHNQFGLCQETLYLAGKNLDRYLQLDTTISRSQLQLAGVTALYIAVKFEEVSVPPIADFSAVSDNAFKPEDVRNMENRMLKILKFDVASPLPVVFLRRCSKTLKANISVYMLSKYIMELSLLDYNLCHVYPSMIAAGCLALALMVLDTKPISELWTPTATHYCRYSLGELKSVLKLLSNTLSRNCEENSTTRFHAIPGKYSRSKLMRTSKMPQLQVSHWKNRVLTAIAGI